HRGPAVGARRRRRRDRRRRMGDPHPAPGGGGIRAPALRSRQRGAGDPRRGHAPVDARGDLRGALGETMIRYGARTLFRKEVRRFLRVFGQTLLTPVVTTALYLVV